MPPRTASRKPADEAKVTEHTSDEHTTAQVTDEAARLAAVNGNAEDNSGEVKADDKPKRNRNKALAPVPVDVLGESEDVPEEEWELAPLHVPDERDAAQLVIDGEVKAAYDKWVEAGKPNEAKSPRKRRRAAPEHAPAIRQMIGKAARFHNVRAILSKPTFDADGREIIVFTVRDKVVRDRSNDERVNRARAWAESNGYEVNKRGRLSEEIMTKYNEANPDDKADDKSDDKSDDKANA